MELLKQNWKKKKWILVVKKSKMAYLNLTAASISPAERSEQQI